MLRVCDRRGSGGDMVERRRDVEAGRREGKEPQTPKRSRDEGREHGDNERKRKRSRKRSAKERSRPISQYFGARFPHFQGRRVQAPRVIQHLVAFAPSFFSLLRRLPSPVSAYIHTSSSSPSSSRSTPAPPPLKKNQNPPSKSQVWTVPAWPSTEIPGNKAICTRAFSL